MPDSPKYIFASQFHFEPNANIGGDIRLTLDLQKMISDRFGHPPTPPKSKYHGLEFEDPSVIVVSVNHVPNFRWYTEDDKKRWVGIAVRNDMGLGDLMVDQADVVLEPDFSPLPDYVRKRLNPQATVFPVRTLPSRCSPATIKAAAEEYCKTNPIKKAKPPITTIVIGDLRPQIGLAACDNTGHQAIEDACAFIAQRSIHRIQKFIKARNGSVLLTTSRRTNPQDEYALVKALQPWLIDSITKQKPKAKNPYEAFLGLADEILVYGDSISMISDVVASKKPFRVIPNWNFLPLAEQINHSESPILSLVKKCKNAVQYVADQYAEFSRAPLIIDTATHYIEPHHTRRPIAYAGSDSSNMAAYITQNILTNGGKDLRSDQCISEPPTDFSGLDTAVDGICTLIRKKSMSLGLGS